MSISVRPNSQVVAFSCENNRIYEWDFKVRSESLNEIGSDLHNTFIEYSPDGNYLSVCSKYGTVHLYDVKEKKWLK